MCIYENSIVYENSIAVIYVSASLQLHNLFFFCSMFLLAPWNHICITCIEREHQAHVTLYPHYRNDDNVCMYRIIEHIVPQFL